MRYLDKVILINSANVKYAEIALDGNVHFIGTQGVGKSTLLRAILFFYNADKLRLGIEKGKKTFDEYYFPYANSYVIYEVVKETGNYCVMAFRSQGRTCFRFINSGYEKQHYIDDEGRVKTWDAIRDGLGKKTGYSRKVDRYEEYRDVLYGNNKGVEKEFRKYALIESRQYQNIPRTIQNVFLNSKLDAEFIKQTIIMSLNEDDVKIDLEKYVLHLKDFDTQLADINKWTEVNKAGEIPVRKMAENIGRLHTAIQLLNREKQETAAQLFHACDAAVTQLPQLEKNAELLQQQKQLTKQKTDDLLAKFTARKEEIQKLLNVLDNDLKKARSKMDYYESIDIEGIMRRVGKNEHYTAEQARLHKERELLNAKFSELNNRYEALIQQQQGALAIAANASQAQKNQLREELLQFRQETDTRYYSIFAEIRDQHQAAIELARNSIGQKKDNIHELKLKKQAAQLQQYYRQEIETLKEEISGYREHIRLADIEIADHRKQVETLQKQWEAEQEREIATFDHRIEKMWEDDRQIASDISAIDAKLQHGADTLYGWLNTNMEGWERSIGSVIDEEQVLFREGLSPQLVEGGSDSFFGLKIDLEQTGKTAKTIADYERERYDLQLKAEENRAKVIALTEEKNTAAEKLKSRYQGKIKTLNNDRKQLEYQLQRYKGQLQSAEVKLEDTIRAAAQEKEKQVLLFSQAIEVETEELLKEEGNLDSIAAGMQRQITNREREKNRKLKAEDQRISELEAELEAELETKQRETEQRVAEIKQQQTLNLQQEGADVARLAVLDNELAVVRRELDFINANRDRVVEYRKDKKELFDHVDSYRAEKRAKEIQLANEDEKYELRKQKLQQETDELVDAINSLDTQIADLREGLSLFGSFRQTDLYNEVAEFENGRAADAGDSRSLKALIDAINGKIYTLQQRYNDLQTAANKFLGNFYSQNIFGFKTNLLERSEFVEFAEMLNEFVEEDKIVQYEKRVNERFATLIRQIGKETTELTSRTGEIQKVIAEINRDFEERNFAGVIKSIKLQLTASQNNIVALLQEIRKFNDENSMSLGVMDLFSTDDNETKNKKATALLKQFAKEIANRKEKEIGLADSFELQFRIVENENDSGWVEKLTNVGSEGTDILVKAMVNIMLLNVFKDHASRRFKEFRLHCMMDEIGKLHPNNVKGILKFANDRNILLINSSPTSYNATDYRYTYLLSKDANHVTTVTRLVKKGAEA